MYLDPTRETGPGHDVRDEVVFEQGDPGLMVDSVCGVWPGAEWMEREAYDMFGIIFEGNRDLRRIYMPADYQSFPLRKDFYLPDDAARSPGAGVRHMEQTHAPSNAAPAATIRRTRA